MGVRTHRRTRHTGGRDFRRPLGTQHARLHDNSPQGGVLSRNGVPKSVKSEVTTRIHRYGNLLTVWFFINDPAYLTAPYIRASSCARSQPGHPAVPL